MQAFSCFAYGIFCCYVLFRSRFERLQHFVATCKWNNDKQRTCIEFKSKADASVVFIDFNVLTINFAIPTAHSWVATIDSLGAIYFPHRPAAQPEVIQYISNVCMRACLSEWVSAGWINLQCLRFCVPTGVWIQCCAQLCFGFETRRRPNANRPFISASATCAYVCIEHFAHNLLKLFYASLSFISFIYFSFVFFGIR